MAKENYINFSLFRFYKTMPMAIGIIFVAHPLRAVTLGSSMIEDAYVHVQ